MTRRRSNTEASFTVVSHRWTIKAAGLAASARACARSIVRLRSSCFSVRWSGQRLIKAPDLMEFKF